MTFAQIKTRVAKGISRDDLSSISSGYGDFINEAQDEICRRRSWLPMRTNSSVTILSGSHYASLPTNFKELVPGRTPIHYTDPITAYLIEVDVMTRAERIRRSVLFPLTGYRVFIDHTTSPKRLDMYDVATADIPFDVSYYAFPTALSADGDNNFLTNEYPEMLIAKTKAIALASVNDPLAGDFETLFEKKYAEAKVDDARRSLSGRAVRM